MSYLGLLARFVADSLVSRVQSLRAPGRKKTAAKAYSDRGVCIDPLQFKPNKDRITRALAKGVVRPGFVF